MMHSECEQNGLVSWQNKGGVNKTKESATIVTLSFVLEAGLEPAQAFMPKGF